MSKKTRASAQDKRKHALAITPPDVLERRNRRRWIPDPDLETAKADFLARGGTVTVLGPARTTTLDDDTLESEPNVRWDTVREGLGHRPPPDDDR